VRTLEAPLFVARLVVEDPLLPHPAANTADPPSISIIDQAAFRAFHTPHIYPGAPS
jgi:hypothetical protein